MFYKSKVAIFLTKHHQNPSKFQFLRTFVDNVEIKFIRDRGLDHAVEREKDLKTLINLKNLLKLEPSKSLPISTIVDNNETLKIPYRPIEFIRKYPSVFEEFFPANIGIHPHVRLTPKSLDLDGEEQLIFDSDNFRKNAADRLLKLLMLCRVNEIPLKLIDKLKWDLGLPDNYVTSLVPQFPDYFQVKKGKGFEEYLELVCWSDDLAVSNVEKMAKKLDKNYQKGMPIEFPMKFSKGFDLDKKLKKWIDEWQKLPYVSPYENFVHLQPNCDMSDRWAVAVVHELLNILVPKKTERDNVLCFGEYLGVKPRFKRAMGHHPGIFYVSSKIGTYTVVLREAYKRGLLVDKDPLIDMRSKYIHLMHTVKEAQKSKSEPSKQKSVGGVVEKGNEVDETVGVEEMEASDSNEDESDDDEEDEEDEAEVNEEDEESGGRTTRRGGRGLVKVNDEGSERGGRSGRRGFNRVNDEGSERGGRSGRRGFNRVNDEGRERGGSKNGRRGFNKVNDEGRERGGRSGRRGFNKVNDEGRERGGGNNERRVFNKGNDEERERGGGRSGRGGFNKVNSEGRGRGGFKSEGRGFNRGNEERSMDGNRRSDDRSGRRGFGRMNDGGRKPGRTSERENSPRKRPLDS
ncbi:hypothetical protein RND81_06G052000 [Saponaria officinalis]|uniref:PORR domain-containing protein n=1 Tax=Saponaria officinalis TaxID=3572 RepID=A0AAW1K967_SAPOF